MEDYSALLKLDAIDDPVHLDLAWFQAHVNVDIQDPPQILHDHIVWGRFATLVPVQLKTLKGQELVVMIKRVVPDELPGIEHYEPFIASAKREMYFYRDEVEPGDDLFPHIYASLEREVNGKPAFILVMEEVKRLGYTHIKKATESMQIEQALATLARLNSGHRLAASVARFVAYGERHSDEIRIDASTIDNERGGFWVLARRPELEIKNAAQEWASFLERFQDFLPEKILNMPDLSKLGQRLAEIAPDLEDVVRQRSYALIHGDAKSWNLFYPRHDPHAPVKLIDMQWKGYGHPLQDFVYFMTTSVDPELLKDPHCWRCYLAFFRGLLVAHLDAGHVRRAANYREIILCSSLDDFEALADIVWLDYVRVIALGLWRRLDPAKQEANAQKIGISLVTGSVEQMYWILEHALKLLASPTKMLAPILEKHI